MLEDIIDLSKARGFYYYVLRPDEVILRHKNDYSVIVKLGKPNIVKITGKTPLTFKVDDFYVLVSLVLALLSPTIHIYE